MHAHAHTHTHAHTNTHTKIHSHKHARKKLVFHNLLYLARIRWLWVSKNWRYGQYLKCDISSANRWNWKNLMRFRRVWFWLQNLKLGHSDNVFHMFLFANRIVSSHFLRDRKLEKKMLWKCVVVNSEDCTWKLHCSASICFIFVFLDCLVYEILGVKFQNEFFCLKRSNSAKKIVQSPLEN